MAVHEDLDADTPLVQAGGVLVAALMLEDEPKRFRTRVVVDGAR